MYWDYENTSCDIHARIQRGMGGGGVSPEKKIVILTNLIQDPPEKSQNIQCWAIISTPAKRHLNAVSLAGQ